MLCFTIRDVLWLTVVVAVVFLCWVERTRVSGLQAKIDKMQIAIEGAGYALDYAWPHLTPKR